MKTLFDYSIEELKAHIKLRTPTVLDEYYEERFCKNCGKDQIQRCHDSGHERDSSGDYERCTVCKCYRHGWGEQQKPLHSYAE